MTATIEQQRTRKSQPTTLAGFLKKYRKGTAGYKYEWNRGIIEKTTSMKQDETFIIRNLTRIFLRTEAFRNGGWLMTEIEVWTADDQWRKPDAAYFTEEQVRRSAKGERFVPAFVVEVISTFDPINIVTNKVLEYFAAGVQVLWHIFPQQKMVYVFTSPKTITVCTDDDFCSAESVLPEFKITANDLFKIEN